MTASYGDPRLYAISVVAQALAQSEQPLVPATMLSSGANGAHTGLLGTLMSLLVAEKLGVPVSAEPMTAGVTVVEESQA